MSFRWNGYQVPETIRVSIGWPKGSHGRARAIGQCWADKASSDRHNEIFVSPELADGTRIIGVLAHELVHAVVGTDAGHKAPFKRCALEIGLAGKMTATTETPELVAWAQSVIAEIGAYPAGSLRYDERKKQTTRLVKCECNACGYLARVTRKWIDTAGAPLCPDHGTMIAEGC